MWILLSLILQSLISVQANHPGHHHHGHGHGSHSMSHGPSPIQHAHNPTSQVVSSFSHKLPGTDSFMSVTRYFNGAFNSDLNQSDGGHHEQEAEQQRSRVINAQGDQFHPWNPRFQVSRIEASDEEWKAQLEEELLDSGLLDAQGRLLRHVPSGMVNLNYDIHICVHMGTEITPEESAYPPTAISFPGEGESANKLHTLVMLDITLNDKLHWLVINIPGPKVDKGLVIATYAGPNPSQDTGVHKYAMFVMEQSNGPISEELVAKYKSESSCDESNRGNFPFQNFRQSLNLSEPVAVNYFTQKYSEFVNDINGHCLKDVPLQPHPLYR